MTDFTLVDPKGWEYDLHSVYSAYIGYFQMYNVPWYERSWGHLFQSFEEFLAFDWPVITVTDAWTGRAHIVTRLTSIGAFLKMIKTRRVLQTPPDGTVTPFETTNRHLRRVADYSSYKKLHSTLPAAVLSALRARVKAGSPNAIKDVWDKKDKTFLSISFEWSERNEKSVLEWGYAAVRCAHLEALGHWPPVPDANYRKGHYIVAEYVDKVTNKYRPTYPWQVDNLYKSEPVYSSLASPDTETAPNHLVLVGHNMQGALARLEEMKIKLPHNMLIIDTMIYERALYSEGLRGPMLDPKGEKQRAAGSSLSFENLLYSLSRPPPSLNSADAEKQPPLVLPQCTTHNSGNDAFMCLFALQKLLDYTGTAVPTIKKNKSGFRTGLATPMLTPIGMPMINIASAGPFPYMGHPFATMPMSSSLPTMPLQRPSSSYDLASEFGQMQMGMGIGRGNSGNTFLAAPTPPRTPGGGEKSKRFNSFPGVKSDDSDSK
ncbi:hypothetical protein CVT24_007182 [Panaeolus cyanescens]|uniref:Gfd2/YDR514C-like C-terminal domain-containing protein n=1 Tax=Panaeolus cyanescens TaxID=181874 RepID=A0A409VJC4_9AGAR|nr:hypothetical protein CVT24_007182 [Panaeolus cyanescens]